jgi:uncharacterized protein (TIGR03067 family)
MWSQFAVVLLALAPAAAPVTESPVTQEQNRLRGAWRLVGRETNGVEAPEKALAELGCRWVFDGDKITATFRRDPDRHVSSYKLGPGARPKTFDMTAVDGDNKGQVFPGIYELGDDRLRICNGEPKQKRPEEFATRPGDGYVCLTFEHEKK